MSKPTRNQIIMMRRMAVATVLRNRRRGLGLSIQRIAAFLPETLKATASTIRRDLAALEQVGVARGSKASGTYLWDHATDTREGYILNKHARDSGWGRFARRADWRASYNTHANGSLTVGGQANVNAGVAQAINRLRILRWGLAELTYIPDRMGAVKVRAGRTVQLITNRRSTWRPMRSAMQIKAIRGAYTRTRTARPVSKPARALRARRVLSLGTQAIANGWDRLHIRRVHTDALYHPDAGKRLASRRALKQMAERGPCHCDERPHASYCPHASAVATAKTPRRRGFHNPLAPTWTINYAMEQVPCGPTCSGLSCDCDDRTRFARAVVHAIGEASTARRLFRAVRLATLGAR